MIVVTRCRSTMPLQHPSTGRAATLLREYALRAALFAAAVLTFSFAGPCSAVAAAAGKKASFDISASGAAAALKKFSAQSGQQVLYSNNDLAGVMTNEVKGTFTNEDALDRLLANTPLVVTRDRRSGAIAVGRESADPNGHRAAPKTADDRPRKQNSQSLSMTLQKP